MPFTKYEKAEDKQCMSPEHEPPKMIVLKPGTHTWECPRCGKKSFVTVPEITCLD